MRLIAIISVFVGGLFLSLLYARKSSEEPIRNIQEVVPKNERVIRIEEKYCIQYGNKEAPLHVIEYFSFQCPHCVKLFRTEFPLIKREFIDTGKIYFSFHPIPQDLPTVQSAICLETLDPIEKQLFLEILMEYVEPNDPDLTTEAMKRAMTVFKKPQPRLEDEAYLESHPVFQKMFSFLKEGRIEAIPSVEINGRLFSKEFPDYQFFRSLLED